MGSIRLAMKGVGAPFSDALAAYLSSQPVFELVDHSEADILIGTIDALDDSQDSAWVVIGPDDPHALVAAVEAGAVGYLTAGTPLDEIGDALTAVAEGEAVIPPLMLGALLRHVVHRRRAQRADLELLQSLTEREREVFDLLAAGMDRGAIAAHLYISVGTVRSHLQRLFRKLDVHTHAEVVAFAARCGIDTHGGQR